MLRNNSKKLTDNNYRKIAGFMKLDGSNLSNSFRVLCSGIQKLVR